MIILDSPLRSLEIKLAGAVTTNELEWVVSYVEMTTTTFVSAAGDGVSNGATAVVAVAAPALGAQRQIKFLTVLNVDTVAATVTVQYHDNAVVRRIVTFDLPIGAVLVYTDGEGFRVLDSTGAVAGSGSSSSSGLTLLTADPTSPSDDTWWAVRTGVSPTETVAVKARIGGATYTIASITI